MLKSQSLFYLKTALHVLGVTIIHLQEHKTTVTTASGNHFTNRVKLTDKAYWYTRLKLQLLNNVYSAKNAVSSIEWWMMYIPILLSAAVVEELELIWVCCRWRVDLFFFSCGYWQAWYRLPTEIRGFVHLCHVPWRDFHCDEMFELIVVHRGLTLTFYVWVNFNTLRTTTI
jgi:hypothetical protein